MPCISHHTVLALNSATELHPPLVSSLRESMHSVHQVWGQLEVFQDALCQMRFPSIPSLLRVNHPLLFYFIIYLFVCLLSCH